MRGSSNTRTGGEILVDQLAIHGVRHVFCVPGESYLAALDAFHDRDVALTVCRHESAAAIAAEAIGKATGRPGVCFVTRGPGATNASAGIHIARQDSSPLIVFVGQVARVDARARCLPGARLPRGVRLDLQIRHRDRRSRAHPGSRLLRLPHRLPGPPRPGGDRAAGGHADRARGGARRQDLRAGGNLAGPHRHEPPAEDAVGVEEAGRAGRRQPLVAGRVRRAGALCRALCAAGRHHLPPRAFVRRAASLFCRRSRHRRQPEAARAHQGRRPGAAASAAGSANCRRRATRCSISPSRR